MNNSRFDSGLQDNEKETFGSYLSSIDMMNTALLWKLALVFLKLIKIYAFQ